MPGFGGAPVVGELKLGLLRLAPLQNPMAAEGIGESDDVSRYVRRTDLSAVPLRLIRHAIQVFDVEHDGDEWNSKIGGKEREPRPVLLFALVRGNRELDAPEGEVQPHRSALGGHLPGYLPRAENAPVEFLGLDHVGHPDFECARGARLFPIYQHGAAPRRNPAQSHKSLYT